MTRNNSFRGKSHSEQSKKRIGEKNQGRKWSDDARKRISESRKGSKNSFFGKIHSQETRALIGLKSSERNKGLNNPFYGKKHDDESRKKMSESRAYGIANGTIVNTNGFGRKAWYISTKSGESFYADSALEMFYMKLLDTNPTVISWTKRHGIRIYYRDSEEKLRYFVPDFRVETEQGVTIEEVKGFDERSKFKLDALRSFCSKNNLKFRWIEQTELEQLGYRKFLRGV